MKIQHINDTLKLKGFIRPDNPRYTIQGIGGYYYLVDLTNDKNCRCSGYDCADYPRDADGGLPDFILNKYRRALSLPA